MKKNFGKQHKPRPVNHLEEKGVPVPEANIVLSFDELEQKGPGRYTYEDIQKRGKLINVLEKFGDLSVRTSSQAQKEDLLHFYRDGFPESDLFHCPKRHENDKTIRWGHIRKIFNKWRIAGYMRGNVFHIMWLDLDHKFWDMDR